MKSLYRKLGIVSRDDNPKCHHVWEVVDVRNNYLYIRHTCQIVYKCSVCLESAHRYEYGPLFVDSAQLDFPQPGPSGCREKDFYYHL